MPQLVEKNFPAPPIEAADGMLRVTEAYSCIEGEGRSAGALTWLLRLSGCDLRCWWCDSKFSSFDESEAKEESWEKLLREAASSGAAWLSVTGGEPTFRGARELESLSRLCREARSRGMKIKIESNALALPVALQDCVDLWSLSPKWDSRAEGERQRTRAMDYDEQVLDLFLEKTSPSNLQMKFVMCFDTQGQVLESEWIRLEMLLSALDRHRLEKVAIFLIPESSQGDIQKRFASLARRVASLDGPVWTGLDLRVQPQHHKLLYGNERGK